MNTDISLGALIALFCSIGGVLGYVSRSIVAGKKVTAVECALSAGSAAYVCVLTLLLTSLMGWDIRWGVFIAGVFAWAGAEYAMNIYSKIANARVTK